MILQTMMKAVIIQLALLQSAVSFLLPNTAQFEIGSHSHLKMPSVRNNENHQLHVLSMSNSNDHFLGVDRRSMLSISSKIVPGVFIGSFLSPLKVNADDDKAKIVVFGGSGYVGSRVVENLSSQGYDVVSVSRSSPEVQAAKIKANIGKSPSIQYESLDAGKDDLSGVLKGASAVVSCLGVPPWEKSTSRAGNGAVNVRIADAAKEAGSDKFVYISLSSEFANGPAKFLFGDYVKGKAEAESAVLKDFGGKAVLVKPSLIDGAPPGELRPPGPPGIAAISPDAVAKAVVAGALGQATGTFDGYDAIMKIAK